MMTIEPGDYRIEIANSQKCLEIDEGLLRDVASRTLAAEGVAQADISLAIVDDPTIHDLNRLHLAHDEPTDVLSFLLASELSRSETADARGSSRSASAGRQGEGKTLEGEVIASAETAVRRAPDFAWSPHDELVLYIVHGLLHLAGYDDLTPAEKRLMRRRERAILALWGLTPRYRRRRPSAARRAAPAGGVSGAHP
jgi:probable rRNA maturation factor